jgi:hypothetical protein
MHAQMRIIEDPYVYTCVIESMYVYIMSIRTQITLTDSHYARLHQEFEQSGLGLAELVRRALARIYGNMDRSDIVDALEASFATLQGREEDGAAYDRLRPGMAQWLDQ